MGTCVLSLVYCCVCCFLLRPLPLLAVAADVHKVTGDRLSNQEQSCNCSILSDLSATSTFLAFVHWCFCCRAVAVAAAAAAAAAVAGAAACSGSLIGRRLRGNSRMRLLGQSRPHPLTLSQVLRCVDAPE